MKVSIIIGWRSDDPARIRLWDYCRPLWEQLVTEDFEVCVSNDGVTHGPFARARAFNRAAAIATGDVYVIWGADMLPDTTAIQEAADRAAEKGWSLVFDSSTGFNPQMTNAILAGADPWLQGAKAVAGHVPGIIAVRADAWKHVGGMDERFGDRYGFEDCAIRNALAKKYGPVRASGRSLGCLWHPHVDAPDPENSKLFWSEYGHLAPRMN